ncbi:EAL domain-containing protein [Leptolyngbya sp. NK1-12]|uniref:EAL domain-containing protein n=1 Tax=Leptolyngbya sp. NK1-12 TaxID=2547451 RepID=A0AA96WE56_9CYAN|nr:EAL domain-containing protein [Leptolyngbya sp. NK1-12]
MPPAKILVVDDEVELERLIRQRFRKKIQAQEFDFLFAADGVEALRWLQSGSQVDMVLTDINMPKMDGLTLLGRLAEIDKTLKAVVISAYGDIPNIRRAMNRGAFDFLTKPIDFQDLELTIQKTLQSVQAIREQQQQLQQAQQALMRVAYYDSLTGLPNRSWFIQRLAQLIEQPPANRLYAVLFIDLDRFKLINDSLGHAVGDLLLQSVAHRLKNCLRESDVVARLGGDEFAILLEAVENIAETEAIARRIQAQLKLPFQIEEMEIYSQASIGITLNSLGLKRYDRPEELLRDADVAMYCAKAQGKGRFQVFDPIMQIRAKEYLDLENDLRRAISRRELSLHYQPIISTESGKLDSFETLIRWQHPSQGQISPSKFIPLAEETRLVVPLGWWVFEAACQQLQMWQQQFQQQSIRLNINCSAIQLQQKDLVERISRTLQSRNLRGEHLKLEITESYLLENIASQTDTLNQLKELGIQLCIDDFGVGYSSLSRLHEFPIDILKIDRSFIQRVDISAGTNLETIKMIITLAHSLGMDVVAEGVETPEQLAKLRELGCNFVQGYLFSHPVDSQAASRFLTQGSFFE